MHRYALAALAALVLVIGAYFLNRPSTGPPLRQDRVLPNLRDLRLR
jgi:hypothetical protein